MKDKSILVAIIIGAVVFIGIVLTIILVTNANFASKSAKTNSEITSLNKQISDLSSRKDNNGYTPTDVVIAFLNEVKSDNNTNAKLYLSSTVQNMDIKNTLKLGSDLANINIGDNQENISDSDAVVDINIQVGSDTVAREFTLSKENDAWKITDITAE
jgi:type III secretory pathway component EscV